MRKKNKDLSKQLKEKLMMIMFNKVLCYIRCLYIKFCMESISNFHITFHLNENNTGFIIYFSLY